jgi:organic radical activating enzyme
MFRKWLEKYSNTDTEYDADICISEFKQRIGGRRVFFWGANSHAKTMFRLFSKIGINVFQFIDKNAEQIRSFKGIPVRGTDALSEITQNDILFAAVNTNNYRDMLHYLDSNNLSVELLDGFAVHYPLQNAVCQNLSKIGKLEIENCSGCTRLNHTCRVFRDNLIHNRWGGVLKSDGSDLTLIGCILGTICTLKCRHCVEHVPYVDKDKRKFLPAERIIEDIRILTEASKFITVLAFVGGEPFLHPELPQIIKKVRKITNIGMINVFTNGTVTPTPELMDQLKRDYIVVNLSNYSANLRAIQHEQIMKNKMIFQENGMHFFETKNFSWSDTNSFDFVDDDESMLAKRFNDCALKDCHRLVDGKMFRCGHHYAGYATEKLELDDSVIDIRSCPKNMLPDSLNHFLSLPYINACRRCELPYKAKLVSSGEQLALD